MPTGSYGPSKDSSKGLFWALVPRLVWHLIKGMKIILRVAGTGPLNVLAAVNHVSPELSSPVCRRPGANLGRDGH